MISIIMPTRKRPNNLERLFQSIWDTAYDKNIQICARIDKDDDESYQKLNEWRDRFQIKISIGDRQTNYGYYWNDAWKTATGDIYMMAGDDFIFRTPNWDTRILNEFSKHKNRIAYIYGEDGLQHGVIGTHGFVSKEWTDALGYFVPMHFAVYYHDTWLTDLAHKIGKKIYIPELFFEHCHFSIGKSVMDENYIRMDKLTKECGDNVIWNKTEGIRIQDADKLRRLI